MEFDFTLQKYSGLKSRYTCPACGKARKFTRYISKGGEYLAEHVGKCERIDKCGYQFKPRQFFESGGTFENRLTTKTRETVSICSQTDSFIPNDLFERSLSINNPNARNNFIEFLKKRFDQETVEDVLKRFPIGTSKHWHGATIFWQVDVNNKVRTGKVMLYDVSKGKRVKEPYDHVTWAHALLKKNGLVSQRFNLSQSLFGVHQISQAVPKEIIILESEKTAIIASIYLPQFIWMACGGLTMLNAKVMEPIKDFSIILYPDLNAKDKWETKATELKKNGFKITVSNLLDTVASDDEHSDGLDLADLLLKTDPIQSPIRRMIKKNPNIKTLIECLDLQLAI